MSKNKNKIEFKGLVAYNHVQKFVKLSLQEQDIRLRKSKYFQKANKNSYRDIVKRAFDESKGKSKKQIEKITLEIVNKSLQDGGYKEDFDFEGIAYWELEDFLLDLNLPKDQNIQIEQSNVISDLDEELENIEGSVLDVANELLETRRILNKYRDKNKLDSGTVPSFSGFKDIDGIIKIKLIENAGSILLNEQDSLIEELTEKGISTKEPIFEKPKPKTEISKDEILKDEEVIQAKEKTKQEKITTLKLKKLSLMDDFRFAKEMDDKDDMKTIKAKIKAIQKQID